MTQAAAIDAEKADLSYNTVRERIEALAADGAPGALRFVGDGRTLGAVYRDDDLTVTWAGGITCVAKPDKGPAHAFRLVDTEEELESLIEQMCWDADVLLGTAAEQYRSLRRTVDPKAA